MNRETSVLLVGVVDFTSTIGKLQFKLALRERRVLFRCAWPPAMFFLVRQHKPKVKTTLLSIYGASLYAWQKSLQKRLQAKQHT